MASVKLSPVFNSQIVTPKGAPAVGWKIMTCAANSATPLPTFTDSTGAFPQSNPIITDLYGFPQGGQIWLTAGVAYKLILMDENDVVIKIEDFISGVNDTGITNDEWVDTGVTPTYISTTSYTLPGDQTAQFHINRRQKYLTTGGTVYGRIVSSVFTSLTTVTVQMDGAQVLDSGLSVVQNSILRANVQSVPEYIATTSGTDAYTANVGMLRPVIGKEYRLKFTNLNTIIAPTLALDGTTPRTIVGINGTPLLPGAIGGEHTVRDNGTNYVLLNPNPTQYPFRRQTVIYGPVDANGLAAFGGATGSGTVTAAATLVATAANVGIDRIGSITNPSWTGLAAIGTGTGYLNLVINADGTCTPVLRTLQSIYRNGGADVITAGQFVFNTQEMIGKVGNGTVANQAYEVIVGEAAVTAGVVTSISWYQLRNHYYARDTGVPSSSRITKSHLIGMTPRPGGVSISMECQSADVGYSVLDQVPVSQFTNSGQGVAIAFSVDSKLVGIISNTAGLFVANKGTGSSTAYAAANWDLLFDLDRGWA